MQKEKENEDLKNQYHPAFCNAMMQILEEEPGEYEYDDEFSLNTLPNRIDFLVIRKNPETKPENGIGKLFKTHNLFEYKSPGQALGVDEYHQMMGYAHLYVYREQGADYEEVTLSFVRKEKPLRLIKYFKEHGFCVQKAEDGIYHVLKEDHVDMQIIVTRELKDRYLWLKVLTSGLEREEAMKLSEAADKEKSPESQKRIRTILDLVSKLNQKQSWMEEWKMGFFKEYEKKFEEYQEKFEEYEERCEEYEERCEKYEEKCEKYEEKCEKYEEKCEKYEEKCEKYEEKCEKYEEKCEKYEEKMTEYQDKCAEQDKQIKNLNEELNSKSEENSRLARELEKYKKLFGKGIAAL